jgi:alcohol dehydrogenase
VKRLEITAYGPIERSIRLAEAPVPAIGDEDLLIEVAAASINPLDLRVAAGELRHFQRLAMPAAMGFDCSGTVAAVGRRVRGFAVGDAVYARAPRERMGTFAEFAAIDSCYAARMPAALSMVEAAAVPLVGLTCVQALVQRAQAQPGQRILIHAGSGGLGSFAVQYAKHALGLHVTTTTSRRNAGWVAALGADIVIAYDEQDYRRSTARYDIVLDALGGRTTLDSFDLLKPGGSVVSVAGPPDREFASNVRAGPLVAAVMWGLGLRVRRRARARQARYFRFPTESSGAQLEALSALLQQGKIRPVIDRTYPLSDAMAALAYSAQGRAKGKIVLLMPGSANAK